MPPLDITLPGTDGLEPIKLIPAEQPKLRILVVSMHDESLYALRSLRAGAKGYLMKAKALEHIVIAVRKVAGDSLRFPCLHRASLVLHVPCQMVKWL
jgi:DNA-binding NarL/FixJ family response regulator